MKYIWLIIFLVLPIVGIVYTAWRLWNLLPFAIAMKWVAVGILVLWFCTIFIAFSGTIEKMSLFEATVVYEVGYSFIFILMYLVMLFLVLDFGRLVHIVPKTWLFDNGYTSIAIFAVKLLLFGYGNIHYDNKKREQIDIRTDKAISSDKKSTKIVLLSDLHLGYHNRVQTSRNGWIWSMLSSLISY